MKKQVLLLNNGLEFYVQDEIVKDTKRYILAFQLDNEGSITNNFVLSEVNLGSSDELILNDVEDNALFSQVSKIFIKRMQEN